MKIEKTYDSHTAKQFHAHGALNTKALHLRLVKPEILPLSVEYIIGEDVEHFRNVEDFLCDDCDGDMSTLLPH